MAVKGHKVIAASAISNSNGYGGRSCAETITNDNSPECNDH